MNVQKEKILFWTIRLVIRYSKTQNKFGRQNRSKETVARSFSFTTISSCPRDGPETTVDSTPTEQWELTPIIKIKRRWSGDDHGRKDHSHPYRVITGVNWKWLSSSFKPHFFFYYRSNSDAPPVFRLRGILEEFMEGVFHVFPVE